MRASRPTLEGTRFAWEGSGGLLLDVLRPGDEFGYVFDLGDNWRHRCAVDAQTFDPAEHYHRVPRTPIPVFGWGTIPDPYGRLFLGDDGGTPVPRPPEDFPRANAPEPTVVTLHAPGRYTLTRTPTDETDDADETGGRFLG
jgi:hypothetical protein